MKPQRIPEDGRKNNLWAPWSSRGQGQALLSMLQTEKANITAEMEQLQRVFQLLHACAPSHEEQLTL